MVYLLVHKDLIQNDPVYETYDKLDELCAHITGISNCIIWYGDAQDWTWLVMCNEQGITVNRELSKVPVRIISALL